METNVVKQKIAYLEPTISALEANYTRLLNDFPNKEEHAIIHRSAREDIDEKIRHLSYLKDALKKWEEEEELLKQETFSGPYTIDNRPKNNRQCIWIFYNPDTKKIYSTVKTYDPIYDESGESEIFLRAGLIFPNNLGGQRKAESLVKNFPTEFFYAEPPLSEHNPPKLGEVYYVVFERVDGVFMFDEFLMTENSGFLAKAFNDEKMFSKTISGLIGAKLKTDSLNKL